MNRAALSGWLLAGALAGCEPAQFLPGVERIDLLIENARVVDGTGTAAFDADVVVSDGHIVFVGNSSLASDDARVRRRIDAAGRVVAPGIIDLHSHGNPLETPAFENFLAMGVTTISLGQDGSSPDVADLRAWLEQVEAQQPGVNIAMFVGHGTLRQQAGIGMAAEPEAEQMAAMLEALDEMLGYTFGLSQGLEYSPGLYAQPAELAALARVVGRHDRVIMSHLRNEDDDALEEALAELLEQGSHARVHVAHLKSVYGKGAARAQEIVSLLASAREAGIEVTADVYPYTASYTGIGILFPPWAKTRAQFDAAIGTRREELADYLRRRVERRNGPEATLLGTPPYTGKTLAELAHEREMAFEDVLIDVIGPDGASGAYFVMNEALQAALYDAPFIAVASDGSPTGHHPRGHGTFARIIEKFVVESGQLSLEEAVYRMTGLPAEILKLDDRGRIATGRRADLVMFDPACVEERASYVEPHRLAVGFDLVVVNGRIAREDGRLATARHGRVLYPEAQ